MFRGFSLAIVLCILFVIVNTATGTDITDEHFHEELVVRPLAGDHVNTYFQFTTRWHYGSPDNLYHTRLTPRVIAEILQTYDVKELHISLTQGLWRYETWGYPIVEATGGAEMWAWFSGENLTDATVTTQWNQLANVFSGILCASLNFVDNTNSISPKYAFRPQFMPAEGTRGATTTPTSKYVRYATLPREIVCTENLTPWKKLLPCGSATGFASLLNSGYVHNTKYHSLGLKVRTLCSQTDTNGTNDNCIVELIQTANLVYDIKLLEQSGNDFSMRRLFGMGLNGYCELANSSMIYVQRNEQGAFYQLSPPPQYEINTKRGGQNTIYGVYEMQSHFDNQGDKLFNIAWIAAEQKERISGIASQTLPPIYAHRYLLGNGQERGRIATEVTNMHYEALPVLLQEMVPWFVHTYLHTLRIHCKSNRFTEYGDNELKFKLLHYSPGKQRELSTHLEIGFLLPPQSTALITIEVDYLLLKWLEYPPDANHGHYIGAAVITTQLPMGRNYTALPPEGYLFAHSFNATRPGYTLTLHTEALIVSLPTPDFSMPYNVICLACTVVALAFGPIHSVATKQISVERITTVPRNIVRKLWHKLTVKAKGKSSPPPVDQTTTTTTNATIAKDKNETIKESAD